MSKYKVQYQKRILEQSYNKTYEEFLEQKLTSIETITSEYSKIQRASASDAMYAVLLICES